MSYLVESMIEVQELLKVCSVRLAEPEEAGQETNKHTNAEISQYSPLPLF